MIINHTIPYYNLLMKCAAYTPASIRLPDGYRFRDYQDRDAMEWAWLEHGIQDFDTFEEALRYFQNTYFGNMEALRQRFICVESSTGKFAGCVIAWREQSLGKMISTVHWLVVSPEEQRKGIGRALIQKLLECFQALDEFPVYLHSQPWSYAAIALYASLGFRALKQETILEYENQYQQAVDTLKPLMPPDAYGKLLRETIV